MNEQLERREAQGIAPLLWAGRYIILASVVVMLLIAVIYTLGSAKVYEASAIIQVNIPNQSNNSNTTTANQGLAENYATLLVSPGFLSRIRSHVENGRLTTSQLESRLKANALQQTALVELHSTGPSPAAAQSLGQQVASEFLAELQSGAASQTAQQQAQIQQAIANVSARITALQSSPQAHSAATAGQISALQASRQALITQSAALVANSVAQGTSATLSAPPAAASSPVKPRRTLNLVAGALLGLLLGVALAWLREALRPGLRSAEEAGELLDVPVLASIPLRPKLRADDPALPEAYDVLQTNLFFAMRQNQFSVVTFIGPNPGVGKTSTVRGLADVAMRGGRRVLVVDGDMRSGVLSSRLGHHARHAGMVELLDRRTDVDEALVSLGEGVCLLPTRPAPVNPPSLLSGSRMRDLMAELRERFDIILIDSPPVAGLADGLILASLSDAVVLVARTGLTKPADLRSAARNLSQSRTPIAGLVVFEQRQVESYYPAGRPTPPAVVRDPALSS